MRKTRKKNFFKTKKAKRFYKSTRCKNKINKRKSKRRRHGGAGSKEFQEIVPFLLTDKEFTDFSDLSNSSLEIIEYIRKNLEPDLFKRGSEDEKTYIVSEANRLRDIALKMLENEAPSKKLGLSGESASGVPRFSEYKSVRDIPEDLRRQLEAEAKNLDLGQQTNDYILSAANERTFGQKNRAIEASDDVNRYFHDNGYEVIHNEGGGDCFFLSVDQAFRTINKIWTVRGLRGLLKIKAKNKPEIFNYFKKRENNDDVQFRPFRGIKSNNEFQTFIMSPRYWADEWAIQEIEKQMGLQFIIYRPNLHNEGFGVNGIECNRLLPEELREELPQDRKRYIILYLVGQHYQLITYDGRAVFDFKQLPKSLKQKIFENCYLENAEPGDANIYANLEDFQEFFGSKRAEPQYSERVERRDKDYWQNLEREERDKLLLANSGAARR